MNFPVARFCAVVHNAALEPLGVSATLQLAEGEDMVTWEMPHVPERQDNPDLFEDLDESLWWMELVHRSVALPTPLRVGALVPTILPA